MRTPNERAPIHEMLQKHAAMGVHSFHVPGHKQRAVWQHPSADSRYAPLLAFDLTELPDTDDLHHPSGAIAEAQRLAADCFGADETRFLVGGSTAGNLAMILGITNPGDLLIVQRNVHRSVIHGLMLAGVRAVLLPSKTEPSSGLGVIPDAEIVKAAVNRYSEAKGVILCSPNYYGMCEDLHTIVTVCHEAGMPVLVDEAHGPHFGFHPSFPPSALHAGADIVVQSAHKMLSAMTLGGLLHMQGSRVNRESVRQALRMVQSSSPSFPLLATIDLARRQLHVEGAAAFEPALDTARTILAGLPGTSFRALGQSDSLTDGVLQDPLKIVLYEEKGRLDGFAIRDELAKHGCIAEMADSRYAVLALGIGSRKEDGEALVRALQNVTAQIAGSPEKVKPGASARQAGNRDMPCIAEPMLFNRNATETERIPLEQSVGRTAGEWIVPYPPGIPELFPGERITEITLDRLTMWRKQGAFVQGAEDPRLEYVRVLPI